MTTMNMVADFTAKKNITAIDYDTYDTRQHSIHSRRCIDGTITGSGKCVAYCEYEKHPGFLTEKLRAKHKCLEKECLYYLPKTKKSRFNSSAKSEELEQKRILEISKTATSDMEGIRLMRAVCETDGGWTIYYVSIADYAFDSVAQHIEEKIGIGVRFSNLEYRFEIAADLIFGVKSA